MNCCEYCFKDLEIKAIIREQKKKGNAIFVIEKMYIL